MKIEQIYTGCLAEAAYYIESNGEAAIIDPLRETVPYLKKAEQNGSKIKYIFETHFHADFVSGHIDLAEKTGATIIYGPGAKTKYKIHEAKDNEEFKIGEVIIKVLHTPGHTLESSTFLLIDKNGKNKAIFSGDTLFIGDVGRPDLSVSSDLTKEDLAAMLFDSLRNKIMTLEDDVIVYPAHGAGSACGKNMSSETYDTLGNQKKTNYALRADMTKEEFVKELLQGILPPPQYFAENAKMNKGGYKSFDKVLQTGKIPLDIETFESIVNQEDTLILDVRSKTDFASGHIPNSIFIGIDGSFAPWVGGLITDINQPIVLVVPAGREEEVITRLSRVGYDNTLGYLEGGFDAWKSAGRDVETITTIPATRFAQEIDVAENVLDVRKPGEFDSEHIKKALSFPLDFLNDNMNQLDRNKAYYIHCKSGYRSIIACSILKSRGFTKLIDVAGGYEAIKQTDIAVTDYICPTTL